MQSNTDYVIDINQASPDCRQLLELSKKWKRLEDLAPANFFLSWCWISTWIEVFQPEFSIIEASYNNEMVGIGILTKSTQLRHHWLRSRVLRLGQTGEPKQDQIWVEYNDLLLDPRHAETVPSAFIEKILANNEWDELILSATLSERTKYYTSAKLTQVQHWTAPCYRVDLGKLRGENTDYLSTLSRNTRYQINRSRKAYAAVDDLSFSVLSQIEDLKRMFPTLSRLHIQRWGESVSGFSNSEFTNFHTTLIENAVGDHQINICQLSYGDTVVGLLYNFIHKNTVYFYLSGLNYDISQLPTLKSCKPGLLIHAYAIQYYLEQGFEFYDFMGGEARYKSSLASKFADLQVVSFQRNRPKLRLEQLLRKVKHLLGVSFK